MSKVWKEWGTFWSSDSIVNEISDELTVTVLPFKHVDLLSLQVEEIGHQRIEDIEASQQRFHVLWNIIGIFSFFHFMLEELVALIHVL